MALRTCDKQWPVAKVTVGLSLTPAEGAALAAQAGAWLCHGGTHVLLVDARGLRAPRPGSMRAVARWLRAHGEQIDERWVGVAVVSRSPVLSEAVRSLLVLNAITAPVLVCNVLQDATSWAEHRLRTAA